MDVRYNLRSQKRTEKVIPVELQLASDADFLSHAVGSSHPKPGQVLSDQSFSTSASDLDVSGLLENSDRDFQSPNFGSGKHARTDVSTHESGASTSNSHDMSQESINKQILSQLSALGDRLATLEKSTVQKCKKSADVKKIKNRKQKNTIDSGSITQVGGAPVTQGQASLLGLNNLQGLTSVSGSNPTVPPPSLLRQEARIQQEVQQRLQDLAKNVTTGRVKSQRGGPVDFFVAHRVKWPHEYVLSGQNKDRVSYNQLSPVQWMSGFCRNMREEQNQSIKDCMLDYVINLLDDAQDFSWSSAKASHAVLLCRMEQGEIGGWSEVEKIDRVRRAHAQRHSTPQTGQNVKNNDKNQKFPAKFTPCVYFNKNACSQVKNHENKGIFYRHICAACWELDGKAYAHSQLDCRRTRSKNE